MATDEAVDFYQTDALLSAEEKKIRDTVRAFVGWRVAGDTPLFLYRNT